MTYANLNTFEITYITIDGRTYPATGQMCFIQDHLLYAAPGGIMSSWGTALIASLDFRIPMIVDGEVVEENT
jgi:hypothetical protein